MPARTITCQLCNERLTVPDAPWSDQLEWIDSWTEEHARTVHGEDPAELAVDIDPDPLDAGPPGP